MFAYEDSVTPEMIDPVTEANPDLKIETATFDSNEEAAAKLAGGFQADVVEVCADEMQPLLDQSLIRPLDPKGITSWDDLAFTNADGIVLDGKQYGVPLSAGLEGLDLQHRGGPRRDRRARGPLGSAVRRALDDPGLLRAAADRPRRRWRSGSRTRWPWTPSSSSRRSST